MNIKTTIQKIQRLVGATPDGVFGPNTAARILKTLEQYDLEPAPEPPVSDVIDSRTRKNLKTLEPKAQELFLPFIARAKAIASSLGCEYVAISGTRNKQEQDALYAKGRTKPGRKVTNARYGFSNHNFKIALDFGVFANGKYLDGSNPSRAEAVHKAIGAIAPEFKIDWGGNWRSFKDIPHFEVKVPLTTTQKRSRLLAGKSMF